MQVNQFRGEQYLGQRYGGAFEAFHDHEEEPWHSEADVVDYHDAVADELELEDVFCFVPIGEVPGKVTC